MRHPRLAFAAVLSLAAFAGCRSKHVEIVVENRSGESIQLLEVDYPTASFGKNAMAAGEDYHYRTQVRGSGKVKVQYTTAQGRAVQAEGSELTEGQDGRLEIALGPGGKMQFLPQLSDRK